ncbi:MAG TPA: hypothetical protein VIV57_21110 [Anaeromyxobacter sp.]
MSFGELVAVLGSAELLLLLVTLAATLVQGERPARLALDRRRGPVEAERPGVKEAA